MIYCYLFEAKSIQSYLFGSGRLVDIVAASERLDKLVDSGHDSILAHCLNTLSLSHDLAENDSSASSAREKDVYFLRCKGGAFYAYSNDQAALKRFRSLWTLTLQQCFPSLPFADAMSHADDIDAALANGFSMLGQSSNLPQARAHRAPSIVMRHPRTGQAGITPSKLAERSSKGELESGTPVSDLDTDLHRQADNLLSIRKGSDLQERFTPRALQGQLNYWYDLEKDMQTSDIALIHIDGNGLGVLLQGLTLALRGENETTYRDCFRMFSNALNQATIDAAQSATQYVVNQTGTDQILPMRPIVLGGDDVTLLCDAKLALQYAEHFIKAFEIATKQRLQPLLARIAKIDSSARKGIPEYLTASGGIVYHKASHPYMQTHALVESLTKAAKDVDRSVGHISFSRVSNSVADSYEALIERAHAYNLSENRVMTTVLPAYQVQGEGPQSIQALRSIVTELTKPNAAFGINRLRRMLGVLAQGNFYEAQRIWKRGLELAEENKQDAVTHLIKCLADVYAPTNNQPNGGDENNMQPSFHDWYWQLSDTHLQTVIQDVLTIEHFECRDAKLGAVLKETQGESGHVDA